MREQMTDLEMARALLEDVDKLQAARNSFLDLAEAFVSKDDVGSSIAGALYAVAGTNLETPCALKTIYAANLIRKLRRPEQREEVLQ